MKLLFPQSALLFFIFTAVIQLANASSSSWNFKRQIHNPSNKRQYSQLQASQPSLNPFLCQYNVDFNATLAQNIQDQIISQLTAQIATDTTSLLTVTDTSITLTTSQNIIINNLLIDQSIYVIPVQITSTQSITIANITIQSNSINPIFISSNKLSLSYDWFILSALSVSVANITFFSQPCYNVDKLRVIFFDLMNIKNSIQIFNATFDGYSSSILIVKGSPQLTIEQLQILNFSQDNNFILLNTIRIDKIIILNSLFKGSFFGTQSMIQISESNTVSFTNVTFSENIINCSQDQTCSLVEAAQVTSIDFTSCNVTTNSALFGYVFLIAANLYQIRMQGLNFYGNIYSASEKGGVLRVSGKDFRSQFMLVNVQIEACGSLSSDDSLGQAADTIGYFKAIQLDMPNVVLIKSILKNNFGGVFDLINTSSLIIEECLFDSNQAYYAPVINIRSDWLDSQAYINLSNFTSNQAISSMFGNGGAINIDFLTQLKIQESLFFNNTAHPGLYGGTIYFQELQNLIIQKTNFTQNSASQEGGAIYGRIISGQLDISDSTFKQNKALVNGGAISIVEIFLMSMENCTIIGNIAYSSGGFLMATKLDQLTQIKTTNFFGNYAVQSTGGVFFISQDASWIQITDSQAKYNQAQVGGFIGFNTLSMLQFTFTDNTINPESYGENLAQIGGGVFYGQIVTLAINENNYQKQNIQPQLQTLMSKNYALTVGNGSFVSPRVFTLVGVYEFQNGIGDECEIPLTFTEQKVINQRYDQSTLLAAYRIQAANSNSVVKLQIGYSYKENTNININHTQNYQNKTTQSQTLINPNIQISNSGFLNPSENHEYLAILSIDTKFSDDYQILNGLITETTSQCEGEDQQGYFYLNYQLNYIPDSELNSTITFFNQLKDSFAIKITWVFRKCEVGEIYLEQGGNPLCFTCPYHTYSFSDPYVGKSCVPIPTQGVSESYKNVLVLQNGFWRNADDSADILECKNASDNCIGGNQANNALCSEGHIGPLCEQCDLQGTYWPEPYSPSHGYQCQKCSDIPYNFLWMIIASLAAMSFCIIVCRSTYKNTLNTILGHYLSSMGVCMLGNSIVKQNLFSIYAKIFLSYLQISQVLYNFQIKPFGIFAAILNAISQPVSTTLMSLDCFITDYSNNSILFTKIVIVALLPIGFIGLVLLFIHSLHLFGLVSSQQKKHSLFATTLYCLVNLLQFNIVLFLLQARACREIGTMSVAFLDLTIQCDNSTFEQFKYLLVYPLLAYWTTILPLSLLYFLYTRRNKLYSCIDIEFKLRFLYGEYKQPFFYWELLRLTKRMAIAFVYTEFYSQNSISGLNILFILIVYETAVIRYAPFNSKQINYLEAESMFIAMFNIFLAMLYDDIRGNQDTNYQQNYYSYFWSENTFITGLIVAVIQLSNCYLVLKYIYISIYALFEHHRFVRKIEDKIRRKWPRIAAVVCKIRTNSILVSMRWNIVKKLITSGKIFTIKNRSFEFYMKNKKSDDEEIYCSLVSEIKHRKDGIQEPLMGSSESSFEQNLLQKEGKQHQ